MGPESGLRGPLPHAHDPDVTRDVTPTSRPETTTRRSFCLDSHYILGLDR